jgi:hypothetical protein
LAYPTRETDDRHEQNDLSFPSSTTSTSTATTRRSTVAASLRRAIRPTWTAAATTTTKTICVSLPLSLRTSPQLLGAETGASFPLATLQLWNARVTQDHRRSRVISPVESKLHGSSTQRSSSQHSPQHFLHLSPTSLKSLACLTG